MATYTGSPRTWVAGETLTAALMNSDVRDPLAALTGAPNGYTPTLSVFTPGNGTASGAYIQVGKLVMFYAGFTFGSTSAAASGRPTLTLPVPLSSGGVTSGRFTDNSAGNYYETGVSLGTTTVSLAVLGSSGLLGNCSTTAPFTWATGDTLSVSGVYWAA